MNILQEFNSHLKNRTIKCALITSTYPKIFTAILKCYYTSKEYSEFLLILNKDNENDDIELEGTIWYDDGTYSTRRGDNVNEWWEHFSAPEIPSDCKR